MASAEGPNVNRYRLRLSVVSAPATPVQGDTLFGLVCADLAWREGENAVTAFLAAVDSGEMVLAISNAFPRGLLPLPLLDPSLTRPRFPKREVRKKATPRTDGKAILVKQAEPSEEEDEESRAPSGALEIAAEAKRLSELRYIPAELLLAPKAPLSLETIRAAGDNGQEDRGWKAAVRLHASINRLTGRSPHVAGLYTTTEYWPRSERGSHRPEIDLYVVSTDNGDHIRTLLERALECGYGADASAGKGELRVEGIEEIGFPLVGDRRVALGNFVPGDDDDLSDLRADVMTKFGKTGFAMAENGNPFKKPLIMYREGANYLARATEVGANKAYVGRLVADIHQDPRIKQHAFAPVLAYDEA